jgi:hypothetical protein
VVKIKTHFIFNNFFFLMYLLPDNVEVYGAARQATDFNVTDAHCMPTHTRPSTRTHARTHGWRTPTRKNIQKYVILIAFPLQQWFRERATMLRFTYVACLVIM